MASERILKVAFLGDASSATRAARQVDAAMGGIDGSAQKTSSRFGRSMAAMSGFARNHGRNIGAGLAVAAGAVATAGVREAIEAEHVMAQTQARLESTGRAANVTASHAENLAQSLSRLSGVDDELVQSGENVLLTFTRVRNEVGAGNDVFDQAAKSALDMSVAMDQDLQSAMLMVGKALNDPVRGMTALQRAGVQLTEGQREQITALVESGNTMKAQKIILQELQTEFGGAAEAAGKTMGGSLNRLKNSFEEVTGAMAEGFKPQLKQVADGMQEYADLATEAFQQDERRLESHKTSIELMAELARGVEEGTVTQEQYTATLHNLITAEGQSAVEKARLRAVATILTNALRDGIPVTEALSSAFNRMGMVINGVSYSTRQLTRDLNNVPKTITTEFVTSGQVAQQTGSTGSGKLPLGVGVKDDGGKKPPSFQSSTVNNNTFLVLNESQKRQLKRELDGAGMRDDMVMGRV